MDRFKSICLSRWISSLIGLSFLAVSIVCHASAGYFQLHNLMSAAQKNIPSNRFYNDANLKLESQEQNTGHVVNTTFANDGGMAGCGVSSTLIQYMYQNSGSVDLSKNYIALNVYSQIMGFDPKAPLANGFKGYLTGTTGTNVAYPNTPYHRVIPSLYPAYLGSYNNGLNCGRWAEADLDKTICLDRDTPDGVSKFCPSVASLTYTNQKMQAYVFDSCEDNNGWCRDDAAHIDINQSALNPAANYYLQWKFIKNPYYSDPKAASWYKDFWLAWFASPSRYWSYVTILNAENGVSNVQFNIGDTTNPTWINSHVLAGDNNVTWSSGSNNGQLWQIEPVSSLTDTAPPVNPLYQMRVYDALGYPAMHGTIYQFKLLFDDGTPGVGVAGYYVFYQGGLRVKPGAQAQNMTLLLPPIGTGKITVAFNNLLPSNVSLDSTQPNYLRPVLMSDDGYAWDPDQCANNQCTYSKLPTANVYHLFAHAVDDVSNDLTLRKVNDVAIHSATITFPSGSSSLNYSVKTTDINLSTLYSARIEIPLKFATTSLTPINGNLQALFVPDASKNAANNITSQTQGCFLNTYINSATTTTSNSTICTVYYTVNHQSSFSSSSAPPAASFNVIIATRAGFAPINYALTTPYLKPVQVVGYNPQGTAAPTSQTMPLASYVTSTGPSRSFYLILDPESDVNCLQNLDPVAGVTVNVGNTKVSLTKVDLPVETQITQPAGLISAQVNLIPGKNLVCQAMSALVTPSVDSLKPGIDVVDVIKIVAIPQSTPAAQGIAAIATGDAACLGATDTLIFSNNGTVAGSVSYTTSATSTNIGVKLPAGTYTLSDKPFNVVGGSCQLSNTPTVTLQNNTYVVVNLKYSFTKGPGSTCTATVQVPATWPNGCNVVMNLSSSAPLINVTLSWPRGLWDWTHAQVWGGLNSLNVPVDPMANVLWLLPSWVNGQGNTVGMTINNDSAPTICSAFSSGSLKVNCGGVAAFK